jgi:hypothetical protein
MFRKVINQVLAGWGSLTWGGCVPPYYLDSVHYTDDSRHSTGPSRSEASRGKQHTVVASGRSASFAVCHPPSA